MRLLTFTPLVVLLCCLGAQNRIFAQTEAESPTELLAAADRLHQFAGADATPWHLQATYSMTNGDGHQVNSGTYDFFWAGPQKMKQSYLSKELQQTDFITPKGLLRTGNMESPLMLERRVPDTLLLGFPPAAALGNFDVQLISRTVAGTSLRCIVILSKGSQPQGPLVPTYCLDTATPVVRFVSGVGRSVLELQSSVLLNNFVNFRGHPVSRDIAVSFLDRPCLKIHINVLEDLPAGSDAIFIPPQNAAPPPPERHYVDQAHMDARIVKKAPPAFGLVSNASNLDGRGVLDVVVGKDGAVRIVRSIVGPTAIQGSEIRSIEKQVYQPVLVDGAPTEVETEVFYVLTNK